MLAKKWNYKTHKYDDYVLPQGACLTDDDLGKHINCAVCGQEIILGLLSLSSFTPLFTNLPGIRKTHHLQC